MYIEDNLIYLDPRSKPYELTGWHCALHCPSLICKLTINYNGLYSEAVKV